MSEQKYNAFISYRRTARDTAVAKEVQQSLEHFRVPRGIRTASGKERIDRIFRDQEELEITSNLSRRIEDALRASEFLIVICSPGYSESRWCLHELETFIQLRGRDRVLCVLSEGEPPGVFPEILLHSSETVTAEDGTAVTVDVQVEPLACDYRGSFKAARKTELPRLAAVLLGCGYDELVMRRERYRRRRLAAVFSAASVLAAAAIAWLLWSNAQISRNYRQSLISESRLLAMKSLDAFDTEDRLAALTTALQALTDGENDRPVTDEAQYAVAQASYAYFTPYHWLETWRIDDANDITDYFVSRDRQVLVCMDRTGYFRSFDLAGHREICAFRVTENTVPVTPIEGENGELLCYDSGEVLSVDYRTGEENWRLPLKYQSIGGVHLSHDGALVAAEDAYAVQVLTAAGEPRLSLPLPEACEGYIVGLCWSPDDSRIAVKLRIPESSMQQIGIFDVETSAFTLLEPCYPGIALFRFDEENALYLLGIGRIGESRSEGATTTRIPSEYELAAFQDGVMAWSRTIRETAAADTAELQIRETPQKQLYLALGSVVRVYDGEGEEVTAADVRESILALEPPAGTLINCVTRNGAWCVADPESGSSLTTRYFPSGLDRITSIRTPEGADAGYIVLWNGNLCMFESVSDDNIRFFDGEGAPSAPDEYLRSGDRLLIMTDRTLRFYDLNARVQDGSMTLERTDALHLLAEREGKAYLLRISGKDGAFSILTLDMTTGERLREDRLAGYDFFVQNRLLEGPFPRETAMWFNSFYAGGAPVTVQGDRVYLHDQNDCNRIQIWSLADGSTETLDLTEALGTERQLLYENDSFLLPSPLTVSPDGKTLFTAFTDRRDGSRGAILVRIDDGSVTALPGTPDDLSSVVFTDNGVIYAGAMCIYVCSLDGSLQNTVMFTGDNAVSFAWNRGRLYCVFPDSSLVIYENGKVIRTLPLSFDLSMDVIDGKAFRYEFTDSRLYLYCGGVMNAVMLNSDGETAVYYAESVLAHLEDRGELLVTSINREQALRTGDLQLYPGSYREYSVAELIDRAKEQKEAFIPG